VIDLLVAGGGPVGLAVAVRARLAGLSVAVVEPRKGPVDKACGEGLMPPAVRAVGALGVDPRGWPFRGIAYIGGSRRVQADFRDGTGLGVRRTVLHAALAERADELGAARVVGRVERVVQHADRVVVDGQTARWLVAADGLHSPLRRTLGLDRPSRGTARYGMRQHFAVAPWSDVVEVHWSPTVEAYVTPVAADLVGVALLGPGGRSFADSMADFPELASRLAGATPTTPVRGAGPLRQRASSPSYGRVLLVGDAAGYVDALTGEGLAVGLATAEAAVAAIVADDPRTYDAAWRAATRRYRWLTTTLLTVARQPTLRRALVPAAARLPRVFGQAVNVLG
jgi:flavin-dependent dehydrogenase